MGQPKHINTDATQKILNSFSRTQRVSFGKSTPIVSRRRVTVLHCKELTILSLVGIACLWTQVQAIGVTSRVEWPTQTKSLVTNPLPVVIAGVSQGFLGATFHIEQFDPSTTILQGFIVLTNRTDVTNSLTLCLRDDTITYHIEMLDMQGSKLMDPNGALYNWRAEVFSFQPHESKRYPIKVRLQDHFAIKPGLCQLLFIFDERMVKDVGHDGYARKAWSCERLILRCDMKNEPGEPKGRTLGSENTRRSNLAATNAFKTHPRHIEHP